MPKVQEPTAPVNLTFKLTVTIGDDDYNVGPLPATQFGEHKAFRAIKLGGRTKEVHRVSDTIIGPACTCKANAYRRDGGPCKHIRAFVALGLIGNVDGD